MFQKKRVWGAPPSHWSFALAKYSQNEGITAVLMTMKKTSAREKVTARVQVHSKVFRNASTRSLRTFLFDWVTVST